LNLPARNRIGRYVVITAVALAVTAQSLIGVIPAHAQGVGVQSPSYFDRKAVMQRAKTWVDAGVPYDQQGWLKNYRTDCSGFVSMAWGLDSSYVTWSLPEVAKPIAKEDLQPGDIILNTERHVVLFAGWADKSHDSYVVYEEAGLPHKAIKRVVSYPYDTPTRDQYKPYRYTGGHSLNGPGNTLPSALVQTNAGNGEVLQPGSFATAANARIRKAAAERAKQMAAQAKQQAAQAKLQAAKRASGQAAAARAAQAEARRAAAAKAAAKAKAEEAKRPAIVQLFDGLLGAFGA
jgi:hypothetical protein